MTLGYVEASLVLLLGYVLWFSESIGNCKIAISKSPHRPLDPSSAMKHSVTLVEVNLQKKILILLSNEPIDRWACTKPLGS